MLAVGGGIYVLNILAFLIQTPFLVSDQKFNQWLKTDNRCFFAIVTIASILVNYKTKMILFTKLFKFHGTSALL